MVNIPDTFQPFGADYEPVYEESGRLKTLRRRKRLLTAAGLASVGAFGSVLVGAGLFGAMKRTKDAIRRREAEERMAALEAARIKAYEARYGKFDLLQATMNAQRQSAVPLMAALSRSQR